MIGYGVFRADDDSADVLTSERQEQAALADAEDRGQAAS